MRAAEFQALAEQLLQGQTPAEIRSAISRAYYAAYHFGAEALGACGITIPRNASGHDQMYRYLHNSADTDAEEAAVSLHNLRARRNGSGSL